MEALAHRGLLRKKGKGKERHQITKSNGAWHSKRLPKTLQAVRVREDT